jgi:signal peptidase I
MSESTEQPFLPTDVSSVSSEDDSLLMRRAWVRILTFFVTMTVAITVVLLQQDEPLFLFRFSVTNLNDGPGFLTIRLFLVVFYLYITGYFLFFIGVYRRRCRMDFETRKATLETFRKRYSLFDLWTVVPLFVMILVIITGFFFSPAIVEGSSMETTFSDGDPVLIEHFLDDFDSNDVVIVQVGSELLIKRLIGIPGDALIVNEDGVLLNGILIEDYVPLYYSPGNPNGIPYFSFDGIIPSGCYFVMGDNRLHSADSRMFGFVNQENMLGVVWLPAGR